MKSLLVSCLAIVACPTFLRAQQVGPDIEQAIKGIDGLGGQYHRAIVSVDFGRRASYSGEEIVKLSPLRYHLRSLGLFATGVTDHGLRDIHSLSELIMLDLRETRITDDAFEHLGRLKRLRTLWVSDTAITGARLDELKDLNELTHLDLTHTKLDREGVKQLKHFPQLEYLRLNQTSLDNAGVAELMHLKRLDDLGLGGTNIEGAGGFDAAWAAAHPDLTTIYLSSTRLDDRCIPALASLPKLQAMTIDHTLITSAGVRKFAELRRRIDDEDPRFWLNVSRGQVTPASHCAPYSEGPFCGVGGGWIHKITN